MRHTFFTFFQENLIYRGRRLVNWDTFLQTAVSDDEVFHETVAGHFWHLKYPVIDPQRGEPAHVTIATTRPETMLGDTAVAVHPDPARALDAAEVELRQKLGEASDKQRPEIEGQIDALAERRKTMLPGLLQLRDMALAGRKLMLPLLNRQIPLVADQWAKPEMGSGCVKITPAHDPNDYEVGKRQALPMINILNIDGTLNDNAGPYAKLTMAKARERVVADMEAAGLLAEIEDREIELAHSDRSKTPIEPLLADQWFVRMQDLAQSAMDAVSDGRVKIVPGRYANGYLDWLGEKRDWPISRQLWWGHQIPIWYAPGASEADLKKAFAGRDDVVWQRDPEHDRWLICAREEDLAEDAVPGCKLAREADVLDTWFSSALWPHSTLGWPEKTPELAYYYPTSALVTSRDIITLWVARMVLTGLHNLGDVPFREVFIHPKILDGYGETMSKSKGNGVDPVDIMEKFGADALRFGLAYLTTETQDVRMPVEFECPHCGALVEQTKKNRVLPRVPCKQCGQEFATQWAEKAADVALPGGAVVSDRFELARNFCNKLWNAARFVLMNLEGYTPGAVDDADLVTEDRWILSRLATVTEGVTAALDAYHFADATRLLYEFAWDEFCSFYLEMVKARLQEPASRPAAQRVLAHTLDALLRLLHPVIPFITEEIWQLLNAAARRARAGKTTGTGRERDDRRVADGGSTSTERRKRSPFCQVSGSTGGLARNSQPAESAAADRDSLFAALRDRRGWTAGADGRLFRIDGQGTSRGLGSAGHGPGHERQHGLAIGRAVRRPGRLDRCRSRDRAKRERAREAAGSNRQQGKKAGKRQLCRASAGRSGRGGTPLAGRAARTIGGNRGDACGAGGTTREEKLNCAERGPAVSHLVGRAAILSCPGQGGRGSQANVVFGGQDQSTRRSIRRVRDAKPVSVGGAVGDSRFLGRRGAALPGVDRRP